MRKTKKAEIATFLTLGLVVVGAVLSLLSGVMVNKQKNIASNPRADELSIGCKIGDLNCGTGNRQPCSPNSLRLDFGGISFDGNGCDPTKCPKKEIPFACYVVDNRCGKGQIRYRWYGCTGKPCSETIIKQGANGPGKLVGKPIGRNIDNLVEECVDASLIQATNTPIPIRTITPTPEKTITPTPTSIKIGDNSALFSDRLRSMPTTTASPQGTTTAPAAPGGGTGVTPPTDTPTPSPTPFSSIPNPNEVISLKGTATFLVNLINPEFKNYFFDFLAFINNYNIIYPLLKKENSCSLGELVINGCHPRSSITLRENVIKIEYKDLQRYYYDNGLKQVNYNFNLSLLSEKRYANRFQFANFLATEYSQNTNVNIDLSRFLRKISFKFKKESNYIYFDMITISLMPIPDAYFYNDNLNTYINEVNFDQQIKAIYYYDYEGFPNDVIISAYYQCASLEGESSQNKFKEFNLNNLNSTENDAGELILSCSN